MSDLPRHGLIVLGRFLVRSILVKEERYGRCHDGLSGRLKRGDGFIPEIRTASHKQWARQA